MTQKTDNLVASKSQAATTSIGTTGNAGTGADHKTATAKPAKPQTANAEQTKQTTASDSANEMSPEVVELVTELRDTVKRLDPRKHTLKTLRRSLANVSDILKDIEALYPESK